MKIVIAYIKPEMLDNVVYALHGVKDLHGSSICEARGFGMWRMNESPEEVQRETGNFLPNIRIEIVCSENVANKVINVIKENSRTGMSGDGIVFTADADKCFSIRTGEQRD